MTNKPKTEPDEDLFEIELDGIERDLDPGFGIANYDVIFDCRREGHRVEARVEIDATTVPTVELVPTAMSMLHRVFAALAAQTQAWLIEKK